MADYQSMFKRGTNRNRTIFCLGMAIVDFGVRGALVVRACAAVDTRVDLPVVQTTIDKVVYDIFGGQPRARLDLVFRLRPIFQKIFFEPVRLRIWFFRLRPVFHNILPNLLRLWMKLFRLRAIFRKCINRMPKETMTMLTVF